MVVFIDRGRAWATACEGVPSLSQDLYSTTCETRRATQYCSCSQENIPIHIKARHGENPKMITKGGPRRRLTW